jgi:hypothetical protein
MRTVLFWSLMACAPSLSNDAPQEGWGSDIDAQLAPPGTMILEVEGNVLGGEVTFSLMDAYPYEDVEVVIGLGGEGGGPCFSSFGGICLGIEAPVQRVGRIYADVDGAGSFTTLLPPREDLDGDELCVQLLTRRGAGGSASALSESVCIVMGHDADGDGLTSADELELGTDPENPDTDGDAYPDGDDCAPLDPEEWDTCYHAICGPYLHADPDQVEEGWTLCYITGTDDEWIRDAECQSLITHLDTPIFGCWHGHSTFPHENDNGMIENGCVDGVQHTTLYSSWGGDDHILTVCIQDE